MKIAAENMPFPLTGFSSRAWAFAFKTWLAVTAALFVGFWLELEAPSTGALTVTILALPTRGEALEKAFYRLTATVLGVIASIVIMGVFAQTDALLLAVFAIWTGLCVYVAGLLDGNRSYAAALGIITVAFAAIQQIDTPQNVFATGVARGSAIAVGILVVALVDTLFSAPDLYTRVAVQLESLQRKVFQAANNALDGSLLPAADAAGLLREITMLRPDTLGLIAESSSGHARAAAARTAMVNLVGALAVVRAFAHSPGSCDRDRLTELLASRRREIGADLAALRAGAYPDRVFQAPLYRLHRVAVNNGIRAALQLALAGAFFMAAGWPSSAASLSIVAIVIGLGAAAPDARLFTRLAVVSTLSAGILAGIVQFYILDGVSDFPLLALGLAPILIPLSLITTIKNPVISVLGRLNLIFVIAILAPSNPQAYNPQAYLFMFFFSFLANCLLATIQYAIPPLPKDGRLRLLLHAARNDFQHGEPRHDHGFAPEEAMFHDAARIGQMVAAGVTSPAHRDSLAQLMACFDRSAERRLPGLGQAAGRDAGKVR